MPFPGKPWKPKRVGHGNEPHYYREDNGCIFSKGLGCLACPFKKCLETVRGSKERALILNGGSK